MTPVLTTPRLSVILVNYATWEDTARLIGELPRSDDVEVVVVDNHSPRHRQLGQLRRRPGVSLRRWGRNRGFGRAVNEGVRLSRGEWLLLLNPDMSVPTDFLDSVLRLTTRLTPNVGIVGFRLENSDGSPQPSVGRDVTFLGTLIGLLRPRTWRKYRCPQPERACDVTWLSGCCLLIRKDCFTALQGFDPRFFLYYEDVDLCRRARQMGWTVRFEPAVSLRHHRPLHIRTVAPHIRLFARHALLTYAAKHWWGWQMGMLAVLIWIEALLRRRGRGRTATVFRILAEIASHMFRGHDQLAVQSVARVARQEERRLETRTVHRHSQPQLRRSAHRVSEERTPILPGQHADHRGG
jgi:hypothetical protein